MPLLTPTRTSQTVKSVDFVINFDDTMANTAGVTESFAAVAAHAFDVIGLPPGSIVVGGELVTDTGATGSTALNVIVGDSLSTNRYLGTTDKTAAARTALVPTGYRTVGSSGTIRVTITPTLAAVTAGKLTLRVNYVTDGEASMVL